MAKTALERKHQQLERKAKELRLKPDSTYPFLKEPFFQWLARNGDRGDWSTSGKFHLEASQIEIPDFNDDTGPHSIDGEIELNWQDNPEDSHFAGFAGSIGRAECLADDLIAAASNLAIAINSYKQEELNARITEIEESDLSDPDIRKKALADIVRLRKMLERLDKMNRHSIYEYKIKDI